MVTLMKMMRPPVPVGEAGEGEGEKELVILGGFRKGGKEVDGYCHGIGLLGKTRGQVETQIGVR